MSKKALLQRRFDLLGEGAPLFYEQPLHIVRGEDVWLFDSDGNKYLDCYNNVPHVGHCHPAVVAAVSEQVATLNVHTRYLHETIVDYGESLIATFADNLEKIIFVCTGSEANDQALRIARHATGAEGIICTNLTYHGNTTAVDEISPLFYGKTANHPRIRTIPYPDSYRAPAELNGEALADHYVQAVDAAIHELEQSEAGFAGLIVCSLFANEGLPTVPPGYLNKAIERVHAAGGLFIADEVQAGLGRSGKMWGHQVFGVEPDIVTMGKPLGNGFPLAAVAASAELIDGFRRDTMYFNTFGGNPVACAAGQAVLEVMQRDHLMLNAKTVGDDIRQQFRELANKHAIIGDVRGHGLWIGVELVTDRNSKSPAAEHTQRIVNQMKSRGVLLNHIGEFNNVLKMRPPMTFSREHAKLLIETIDDVLTAL